MPAIGSTTLVEDINPGSASSNPQKLTVLSGVLYFQAQSSDKGTELWKYDPASGTAALAADINAGSPSSWPNYLTAMGGKLYFNAYTPDHGLELWKYDPAGGGAQLVKDLVTGSSNADPRHLAAAGGKLYFWAASNAISGRVLHVSDGTGAGTVHLSSPDRPVEEPSGGAALQFLPLQGYVYFEGDHMLYGRELWRTDGTAAGTGLVMDFNRTQFSGEIDILAATDKGFYFTGTDGVHGLGLYFFEP